MMTLESLPRTKRKMYEKRRPMFAIRYIMNINERKQTIFKLSIK